jgi:uncharacterized protein YdiU (UPF0061 family)
MNIVTAPVRFRFDTTYTALPPLMYAPVAPTPVPDPRLVRLNVALAENLGLDPAALASPAGVEILGGNRVAEGSVPIAAAYAGHQFGQFVPRLGDGRAILLGEVIGKDGARRDIQLKGAGRTPYSRGGDGRAALGPVLREYLVSEAMAALGVPTTRALAALTTGEPVFRDTPLPGAVLTRVAASHIRVGTFQFAAQQGDADLVRHLADYAIARHDPAAAAAANPYRAFLDAVISRQAALVARWLLIGFIHGVMNTDNTAISGETIDYGPCAFMDAYDPATVFSSIDHGGRYAYANQPRIIHWNLARLAETLLPLLAHTPDEAVTVANAALDAMVPQFQSVYLGGLRAKIGLTEPREGDDDLVKALLAAMSENAADFTLTFRRLADAVIDPAADAGLRALFADPAAFDSWARHWRARLAADGLAPEHRATAMRLVNPAVIPRNHLVEAALEAAMDGNLGPFEELHEMLARPFDDHPSHERYTAPPPPSARPYQTFCGT